MKNDAVLTQKKMPEILDIESPLSGVNFCDIKLYFIRLFNGADTRNDNLQYVKNVNLCFEFNKLSSLTTLFAKKKIIFFVRITLCIHNECIGIIESTNLKKFVAFEIY